MTKLSVAEGRDEPERFVGILKYYVAFGLIGLLAVGGFAYWAMDAAH